MTSWQSASYIIGSQLLTPFSLPPAQEEFQDKQRCRVSLVVPRTSPAWGVDCLAHLILQEADSKLSLAWMWSCSKEIPPAHS